MYDLIEYCDNFSKTSEWLCQFYRNQLPLNNSALTESKWFKFKSRLLDSTNNAGIPNAELVV